MGTCKFVIHSFWFVSWGKQAEKDEKSEQFQFFKIVNVKNHKTNLLKFSLFMGEMHGIYISHLLSFVEIYEYKHYVWLSERNVWHLFKSCLSDYCISMLFKGPFKKEK